MTITLQPGYSWGPKLTKPGKLEINNTDGWIQFEPGNYDVTTVPVGDNWAIPDVDSCAFTTVKLDKRGCIAIKPRFPKNEPSCGYLFIKRGPYQDGTPVEKRPEWDISAFPSGLVSGRISAPIFSHLGARSGRYYWNGIPWCGEGYFPKIKSGWWGNNPVGPRKLWSNERLPITPTQTPPDVTIISSLEKGTYYISITKVDMFGRETEMSPPTEVVLGDNRSIFEVRRAYDTEIGTSGFYLYIGTSPTDMHRQPILNHEGATPEYLWPLHLQHFRIHSFKQTGIRHVTPPSYGVASIIPKPVKDIVDGKTIIEFDRDSYDLYCPIILPYNVEQINKNGRIFGAGNRHCTFNHKTTYGNAQLVSHIPMVMIENQRDDVRNCTFKSSTAYAGITSSNWSGGQAFKNSIEDCYIELYAPESVGFLVDAMSTMWNGNHTMSECRVKRTAFYATVPVMLEGNQTAKNSFVDMCSFGPNGNTRYKADTVGTVLSSMPNDVDLIDVEGIWGEFRSIACTNGYSGPANIYIENFFVDAGAYVYATFASYNGGKITFAGGERINIHSQDWARLVEAPVCLGPTFRSRDVRIVDRTTAISYQLNQLSLDTDFPVSEFISPNEQVWLSKGLPLEYPAPGNTTSSAYYDFRARKARGFTSGFSDVPDTIPQTQVASGIVVGGAKQPEKPKYENNYSFITRFD